VQHLRAHPLYFLKDNLSTSKVIIFTDGAARGNPGPAAIGVVIRDDNSSVIATISKCLGATTNNQAEYRAIIAGLEKAAGLGVKQVELNSDSQLVVEQICGRYKIKNTALRSLYQEVVKLIGSLESFKITYIPRERNKAADALANQALDNA
jgi:ribonuclease HI